MSDLARLLVILGPTASGKSALGIRLAEQLGGEIVVCDSTQLYRHFDIGTAKVPRAEQRGIPHHLVDLVAPHEVFTAGDYRKHALIVLEDIRSRGKVPILTAGTGLYLRALLEGLADAPARSEELRDRLRRKAKLRGPAYLHRILLRLDRATAARIAPRDTQKIIRAIEMRVLAGKPVGEIHRNGRTALAGYAIKKIGLLPHRVALYARIHARVEAMLAAGWIDETRRLVASGIPGDTKPFQFIGYSQLRSHLEARLSREEAILQIQQATRRFAKRQLTWFRKEPGVHWLAGFGDVPETLAAALQYLQAESP
ncbi:MAG TPA: tRNA (adenosine(37)-N6)-dimethylallyltransferase MiaA [Candidatus Limnocylindria bacterium]|nr:tRNA (adenosine(37)-N6)-dimethylallyltransferase MiaA [Candidatus Limnocylindria bacterium]